MSPELAKASAAMNEALCNFCNNVEDPMPDVPRWTKSVRRDFQRLCEAYDAWVLVARHHWMPFVSPSTNES